MQKTDYIPSFARRIGKSISEKQKNLLDKYLKEYFINRINFLIPRNLILEIGFGGGELLFNLASKYPNKTFIGCEPYMNGVVKLLEKITTAHLNNIFLWNDDVRTLLYKLPNNILDSIYILFPDPWPKNKHKKRRLISNLFLDKIYSKLKSTGSIKIATDDKSYAQWILLHFINHPHYSWDWKRNFYSPFKDWTETSYQKKAMLKHSPSYFFEFFPK